MSLQINSYSDKSFKVSGDTKKYVEQLKKLGGKYNPYLKNGPGWIFSNKRLDEVKKFVDQTQSESDNHTQ